MSTPFGPQLIGETEKTLNALLLRHLDGTGLTEPQWVTLRLSDQFDGTVDTDGLVAVVGDRAHFPDADRLVLELTGRGLLERRPTDRRGPRVAHRGAGRRRRPTWHRSSATSRPTTSPPPPACSTRWSAAPASPWPRRPRSPRDRRAERRAPRSRPGDGRRRSRWSRRRGCARARRAARRSSVGARRSARRDSRS